MSAMLFDIVARQKWTDTAVCQLSDFTLRPAGRIPTSNLIASPDWTLYTVDLATRQAVFVELPPGSDIADAAFIYIQRYRTARRAALLPFDDFIAASASIAPAAGIAFLYSTGRCGSTLASRILAQLPEVWSLSEPDSFSILAPARNELARADIVDLLRAATRWTCRPPKGRSPEVIVIKPRSEATLIAEAFRSALPEVHSLFMYRDLIGFANSSFKFAQRVLGQDAFFAEAEVWRPIWPYLMVGTPISMLEQWFPPDHGIVRWEEFSTLMWMLRIDGYLSALRRGMRFTAIHYADLNANRRAETARLLAGCGISERHVEKAMAGFAEDSHQGANTSNTTPARSLEPEERQRALNLLARLGRRDYLTERLPNSAPV